MRALTLRHPWIYAVLELGKDVENRTWTPSPSELKPGQWFALHGGKAPTAKLARLEAQHDLEWISDHFLIPFHMRGQDGAPALEKVITEGIVAVVNFGGTCGDARSPWAARGQYQWLLTDVVRLPQPIACRGAQKLWEIPEAVLEQVRAGFKAARGAR